MINILTQRLTQTYSLINTHAQPRARTHTRKRYVLLIRLNPILNIKKVNHKRKYAFMSVACRDILHKKSWARRCTYVHARVSVWVAKYNPIIWYAKHITTQISIQEVQPLEDIWYIIINWTYTYCKVYALNGYKMASTESRKRLNWQWIEAEPPFQKYMSYSERKEIHDWLFILIKGASFVGSNFMLRRQNI